MAQNNADRLVIDGGRATGKTILNLVNAGNSASGLATSGKGIQVVEAINGATTEEGAFVQGNKLQAGAFNYSLNRDSDESWYLRSENAYRAEVPLYASMLTQAMDYDRILAGSRSHQTGVSGENNSVRLSIQGGHLGHDNNGGIARGATPESSGSYGFVRLEGDLLRTEVAGMSVTAGVYGAAGHSSVDVKDDDGSRAGTVRDDAGSLGGYANQIRRDRPLTHEELMHYVPGIFGEDKHTSRSQNYTYIPTITVLESLQREGFQPFFACQTRVRDPGRRGYTKHMLRLRRAGEINGEHVPEIILLNSHDGTSSYQMLPGYFRFVCQNGCVCGQSLGEVRVPHRGNVVDRVIEGAYEVVGVFDRIEEKRDAMQSLILPPPARQALAQAALTYRYGDEHQPVTTADILTPRRREDYGKDLWSAYQTIQENMLKGGISGRSAKGKRIHTRAIHSIDTDIKLNRALWVMAETLLESLR
ncbi:hypothetical protein VEE26_36230 [Escherichia coli]|nr:hypothetical protein VEE26_36230 [Escherichia coli]BEB42047.1 hypothetical protein VEE36_00540 [Escherichia coli]